MAYDQAIGGHRTRVLVIDDEEVVHRSLGRIFCRFGFEVEAVYSAQNGLDLLNSKEFNLVVVDLMMPEMNGIQFLGALKSRKLSVPVIMVTGYPAIQTAAQALQLGATDYVTKPFTRKEIMTPIQKALNEKWDSGFPVTTGNSKRKMNNSPPGSI